MLFVADSQIHPNRFVQIQETRLLAVMSLGGRSRMRGAAFAQDALPFFADGQLKVLGRREQMGMLERTCKKCLYFPNTVRRRLVLGDVLRWVMIEERQAFSVADPQRPNRHANQLSVRAAGFSQDDFDQRMRVQALPHKADKVKNRGQS